MNSKRGRDYNYFQTDENEMKKDTFWGERAKKKK